MRWVRCSEQDRGRRARAGSSVSRALEEKQGGEIAARLLARVDKSKGADASKKHARVNETGVRDGTRNLSDGCSLYPGHRTIPSSDAPAIGAQQVVTHYDRTRANLIA